MNKKEDGIPNRGAAYAKARCETVDRSRPSLPPKGLMGSCEDGLHMTSLQSPPCAPLRLCVLVEGLRECLCHMILRKL